MKKMKLITPLVVTGLISSVAPIIGMTSCGGEKIIIPNDISFAGDESEKIKTITDDTKITQTFEFNLDRNIAHEEQVICKCVDIVGRDKDGNLLEDPVNVNITSVSYPERDKVRVVVTPTIESEDFANYGDNVSFDFKFSCHNGSVQVIDKEIDNFKIIYNVDHNTTIPFEFLNIENGVFKGLYPSAYDPKYKTLLIPNSVVEIAHHAFSDLPELVTNVIFEEGDKPLFITQYGMSNMNNVKYLMLPNRLAYAENNAIEKCPNVKTLDLSTWSTTRTSPFADNYVFIGWDEKGGEIKYSAGMAADIFFILKEAGIPEAWLESFDAPEVVPEPKYNFLVANIEETNDKYICGVIDPTLFKNSVLTIPYEFTKIAPGAFSSVFNDWSYHGPVNTIAFAANSNMKRIYGDSFSHNAKITKIDLSNCKLLETIDSGTFVDCGSGLKEVVLPEGIKTIGPNAFSGCRSLTTINLGQTGVKTIQPGAFYNCELLDMALPSTIEWIGAGAFHGTGLTKILIPGRTKYIGYEAFFNCKKAEWIQFGGLTMPEPSLKYIGQQAFDGCENVNNEIFIPTSVEYIGDGAFATMPNIQSIEFYGEGDKIYTKNKKYMSSHSVIFNVTQNEKNEEEEYAFHTVTTASKKVDYDFNDKIISVNQYAFAGARLYGRIWGTDINFKKHFNNIISIGNYAFDRVCLAGSEEQQQWSITLPDSIRSIGDYAFQKSKITKINNFNSNTLLGKSIFSFCKSLESVEIPEGISAIPDYEFEYCSNVKNITINVSETETNFSFGDYCFQNCSGVEVLDVSSFKTVPKSSGRNSFYRFGSSTGEKTIYISDSSLEAAWRSLFSKMGWNTDGWQYKTHSEP